LLAKGLDLAKRMSHDGRFLFHLQIIHKCVHNESPGLGDLRPGRRRYPKNNRRSFDFLLCATVAQDDRLRLHRLCRPYGAPG
jgi:hypothetical protein